MGCLLFGVRSGFEAGVVAGASDNIPVLCHDFAESARIFLCAGWVFRVSRLCMGVGVAFARAILGAAA